MNTLTTPVRAVLASALALLVSVLTLFASAGVSSAAPTAEFTFSPQAPTVGQPVTFTFRGTCDVEPCAVEWTYFRSGGSSLGTHMGRGEVLTYAFPAVGTYNVVAEITNGGSTDGLDRAAHPVVVKDTFQDFDRQVGYNGWRGVVDPAATAGGYRSASSAGSVASFGFTGSAVTYTARTGPTAGIAAVVVDGVPRPPVDLYSRTPGTSSVEVAGLTDAAHRIRVQTTGTSNPASRGTAVTVDEFVVGATRTDDRSRVAYDSWVFATNASASGGTVRFSATAGATTTFAFYGTSVDWLTFKGPRQGLAAVAIDGRRVATLDGYAPTKTWRVSNVFGGLAPGLHTIRIRVLGTHNPLSVGNQVTSDAFEVH
jgi:hypothetical protein